MVKGNTKEKNNGKNEKTKEVQNKSKKYSIKITSKTKRKLKTTQKKLNIDMDKLRKIISHLIKADIGLNSKENEKDDNNDDNMNNDIFSSIFLYITFKKDLNEEQLKNIKKKLVKIKYPMIDKENLHICLVESDLSEKEKEELFSVAKNKCDILDREEFKNILKELEDYSDLDNNYQVIIANHNIISSINNFCDVVCYQKKNLELIKNIIDKVYNGATIIKIVNKKNNILKIKVGYTFMNKSEIMDNTYRLILKSVAFALTNSEKHNGIENIVIKTNHSIPFQIYGNINPEDIIYYK